MQCMSGIRVLFPTNVNFFTVCYDKGNTAQCQSTIGGGDDCTESVFFSDCMKSCGLCPGWS